MVVNRSEGELSLMDDEVLGGRPAAMEVGLYLGSLVSLFFLKCILWGRTGKGRVVGLGLVVRLSHSGQFHPFSPLCLHRSSTTAWWIWGYRGFWQV